MYSGSDGSGPGFGTNAMLTGIVKPVAATVRVRRGESLQSCLARFPQHAADLAPLLQVGQMLRSAPPTLSADAFSRGRVILRDAALADHSASWGQRLGDTLRGLIVPLGLAAAALVVILVIGAAWSSAPGETLYPLRHPIHA